VWAENVFTDDHERTNLAREYGHKVDSLYTEEQLLAYAAAAIAKTIEQCKTLCEGIESGYWRQYKDGGYSSHVEGMSDGAGECAAAIGALGPNARLTGPKRPEQE
jgi:hypothetical protein